MFALLGRPSLAGLQHLHLPSRSKNFRPHYKLAKNPSLVHTCIYLKQSPPTNPSLHNSLPVLNIHNKDMRR